eukprot:TRINITY_DN833_c2_g2_i6.p1 TRINITY_DN833_c2_g2~~TRINITY_DN833_c2_g2_i6.p1  ORF type:complete len:382 (+),score=65.92 TRINITY_DN833_c2_g2_i6:110-1255(+)
MSSVELKEVVLQLNGNEENASEIILENENGMRAVILSYGAALCEVQVENVAGKKLDVTLGFDKPEDYTRQDNPFFGSTVGRVAGRIQNGRFRIPGRSEEVILSPCDAPFINKTANLHGGPDGFNKRNWTVSGHSADNGSAAVALALTSPNLDQGFPGQLTATVTYTLTPENDLEICFDANSTEDTVCSMTNHAYWNLAGHDKPESMKDHEVKIFSTKYLPTKAGIYTGEVRDVLKGSVHDLTEGKRFEEAAQGMLKEDPEFPHGDAYIAQHTDKVCRPVASLFSPSSGIQMTVSTTEPVIQTYYASILDVKDGKGKMDYPPYSAMCIEPQGYADSVSDPLPSDPVRAAFCEKFGHTLLLKKGEAYKHKTVYSFAIVEPSSP